MERLIKTKIFQLVSSEDNKLTTDKNEWLKAYTEFSHSLCSLFFSEESFSDHYNLLTFTMAELQILEIGELVSSPKNPQDFRNVYIRKLKFLLESQMELLKLSLNYPKAVTTRKKTKMLSPIVLSKNYTKTDLIEILTSLDAINFFETTNGEKASFQLVVKNIEWLLNVDLSRPHERREEVLGRKINLTRMIQRMERGIIERSQR